MARSRARPASPTREFQALYRRHYGFVWHAVRRFGVVPALTDDAVQDTFVTAFRRFDELALPTAKAWLYGIARRIASNYRRADHRGTRKRHALALATADGPSSTPPEVVIMLERFLDELAPVDRELFVLSEIEGMSGPEAAQALELNVSTTYSRVQSLRRRFRASLTDADPRDVAEAVRNDRPRATAHAWALLVPKLGLSTAPALAPWSVVAIAKISALAVPVAASVAIGLGWMTTPPAQSSVAHASVAPLVDVPAAIRKGPPVLAAVPGRAPVLDVPEPPPIVATPEATPERSSRSSARTEVPSLDRHNQLLRDAAAQLRDGDAAAALATTSVHAREFPNSPLADARAALRIEALCASDKLAQARGEAAVFVTAYPSSLVRARVERSCAAASVVSPADGQAVDR